jgi:hypothetical protein
LIQDDNDDEAGRLLRLWNGQQEEDSRHEGGEQSAHRVT